MSYRFCWQLASRIRMELPVPSWSCSQAVSKPVWHIPLLCVQWKIPYDRQRNCPKHVEFHSINKFERRVNLVGSIITIYHDVRSPERKKNWINCDCKLHKGIRRRAVIIFCFQLLRQNNCGKYMKRIARWNSCDTTVDNTRQGLIWRGSREAWTTIR